MNKAGLYIRLSKEDDIKVMVSESIKNQKSLLLQYTKENNIFVYDIYIDDGYSGTNFERPSFKRLIKDIEDKKINMVITKDMSRLGRDYIKTGELIEKYFPEHNIRYISVTDNLDTYLDNSNNDIAPFKAIMNDFYAKDISKKIRSSLKAKMKEGNFVGARAPYGYLKDKKNKNHLVINKEQAIVVKKIFNLALNGLNYYQIADALTKLKIRTPSSYYNDNILHYNTWNAKTINEILHNQVYVGDLVQNKRNKINYKIKKVVKNREDEFIIVKNTHEAIIERGVFESTLKMLPKNVSRLDKKEEHLLDSLMYCHECSSRISVTPRRKRDARCYTICNYFRTYRKEKLCTSHSNNYDDLELIIVSLLKNKFLKQVNKDKIRNNILNNLKDDDNYDLEIKKLEQEIKRINENLDNIYLDKLNQIITFEQYERLVLKMKEELNSNQDKINYYLKLNKENNHDNKLQVIDKYIDDFLNFKVFERVLITNLIERIEISENKEINIILTFK